MTDQNVSVILFTVNENERLINRLTKSRQTGIRKMNGANQ